MTLSLQVLVFLNHTMVGGTDTALDGRITMSVNTSNGVKIDGDDVELDYSVITDSDLSSGLLKWFR